ncbi:MAG TPA: hypothetical protein VKL40_03595 [Candidatus Angelobacter sp.]|nr:hypothetical protein [Candidatus Angelobacter sp.]
MFRRRPMLLTVVVCASANLLVAQPKNERSSPQSPRQAIVEMVTGGEDAFKKHLTLEVQRKLDEVRNNAPQGSMSPAQVLLSLEAGDKNFEAFDVGPVLFSLNNPQERQRWEVRVDGDDLRGDEDEMQLSLHTLRQGAEEEMPLGLRLQLSLKQQQGIWRLNAVTIGARLAVGDPQIFEKSWWTSTATANAGLAAPPVDDQLKLKMTPARSLRLIGLAEDLYAQKHPDQGFTCALGQLVEIGRGLEDGQPYKFMPPEFAQGVHNGYRFSIRNCAGKTVRSFQATAEPITGQGKAYCTDQTKALRASDDGNGGTCLASGRIVQR